MIHEMLPPVVGGSGKTEGDATYINGTEFSLSPNTTNNITIPNASDKICFRIMADRGNNTTLTSFEFIVPSHCEKKEIICYEKISSTEYKDIIVCITNVKAGDVISIRCDGTWSNVTKKKYYYIQ